MKKSAIPISLAAAIWGGGLVSHASPLVPAVSRFPLSRVRLLDGPFKQRQDTNARYLLDLVETDRLLAGFRTQAGLPEKAKRYGGWEARGINGHSLGHYLSAISSLYAATGDPKALERVNYVISELAACQEANGDGYVLPVSKRVYEELREGKIKASGFSLNDEWVPNYTLHKVLAGLRDAYRFAGNQQALVLERKLADYLARVYDKLTPAQAQEILRAEFGGMNEVFADLTADTGDPRYLELAGSVFHHNVVLDPLERGLDQLDGQHGNTQIPKIVGLARGYELTGNPGYRTSVETFWDNVVKKRSFVIGGHGKDEHFFPPEKFPENLHPHDAETCNSYNMLKLTGHMFAWEPKAAQMDFAERVLLNHIIANLGRQPGEFGYFMGLESVATKVFSTPEGAWWCCVGSGMENPTRYGEQAYFHGSDSLWVNLFMASELDWRERGIKLRQETAFPDSDVVRFTISSAKPEKFALKIRHPSWCDLPVLKINGQAMPVDSKPSSYLTINREWKSGDVVEMGLPMTLRTEALPYSEGKTLAVLYGPNVLAGIVPTPPGVADPAKTRWGDHLKAPGKTRQTPPVAVASSSVELLGNLKPTGKAFGEFRSVGVVKPQDLIFMPFHRVYEEHYAVYHPLMNPSEWKSREGEILATEVKRAKLDAATVDSVQPGFQQSEVEHRFLSERSETGDFRDSKWRDALPGGWISYVMAVDPAKPVALVSTCWSDDRGREFDFLIDGKKLATAKPEFAKRGVFFEAAYAIPPEMTRGKNSVTVRLAATHGRVGTFGLRILHADAVTPEQWSSGQR